jgi:ABC-type glycerol-3-phosphate transport system substrate-binding protein
MGIERQPAPTTVSRRTLMTGGYLAGAGVFAACSGGPGASDRAATSSETVTVTFYSRTSEEEAFTARTAQFVERYPRIRLDYQPLPGSYPEVMRTHAAAGTLADVLYLQNLIFQGLAVTGDIQPVDALVTTYPKSRRRR